MPYRNQHLHWLLVLMSVFATSLDSLLSESPSGDVLGMFSSFEPSNINLEVHYEMGGSGATLDDSSANNLDGTLVNSPLRFIPGQIGISLSFDAASSQYVTVPFDFADLASAFTIGVWLYKDALTTSANWFGHQASDDIHFEITTDGRLDVSIGGSTEGTNRLRSDAGEFEAGTWYHVGLTWNGTSLFLWKNGAVLTSDSSMSLVFTAGELYLARRHTSPVYWDGDMDEFRIYSRAFTATEMGWLAGWTGTEVYNTNLWGGEGGESLDWTGIAWADDQNTAGNGVAITKRHVIVTEHGTEALGATLTFIAANGTRVEREIIDVETFVGGELDATSFRLCYLDSDLPGTIATYPLFTATLSGVPGVFFDNENKARIADATSANGTFSGAAPTDETRLLYYEAVTGGDSGSPVFLVSGTQLVYCTNLTSGSEGGSGPAIHTRLEDILAACATLDAENDQTGYAPQLYDAHIPGHGLRIGIGV